MIHNSSTFETLDYHPSSCMSELDSLSDSDWLDISSSRESDDNDSIISADSEPKIGFMPLSRRSSISVGSSREGDVEAWEGFIDDSGDEGERILEHEVAPASLISAGIDGHATDPALASPANVEMAEEQRVKEALDQSLVSTLSASRSSAGSTHSSLRDLRLSFPDPLTSSRDELHRSYSSVSPSETRSITPNLVTGAIDDDSLHEDDVSAVVPLDPGLPATPEVPHQEVRLSSGSNKAVFEVVLYGSPSSFKWNFVGELVRKIATASSRTLHDVSILPGNSTQYYHLERKIDESLSISEFVAVHDRTAGILDSEFQSLTQVVERPSLAIVYLPAQLHSIPEHNVYLPVFAPTTTSDELESVARITAHQDWENLHVPAAKTTYLNNGIESPIFDHRNVDQVTEWQANQLLLQLNNAQSKKRFIKSISDHLSSVHAVTLFALMSLIVGFAANTAFRNPSAITPAPASTFWKIFGTEVNRTTVFATTGAARPVMTPTVKNVALSVLNPVTTSLTISSSISAVNSISATLKVESVESKPFAWIDRAKSAKDIIVRPPAQLSSDIRPSTMVSHVQSVAGPSKATSLSSKVVDSLSEVLDTRVKSLMEDVRQDFDELMESLDELARAIRQQTQSTMQQSKSKADAIRESVVHRNDRARGKAKELKKIGEELIVAAGEHFMERTDIAKKKARDIGHSLIPFETWREYQKAQGHWLSRLIEKAGDAERRRDRMNRCNRMLSSRIGRKIQMPPALFGCAV